MWDSLTLPSQWVIMMAGGRLGMQRTLFSIKASSVADLRKYSAYAREEELLLPAGTVFEVQNVKRLARCGCVGTESDWPLLLLFCMHYLFPQLSSLIHFGPRA